MELEHSNQIELSEHERKEAEGLLARGDLLYRIGEEIQQAGVAGEKRNGLIIYLCIGSRILPKPHSALIKGESATGKNYLLDNVVQFFPADAYKELTAMTRQALFYSDEPLSHKAILICEKPGMDKALYNIRALQSEGKLVLETVQRGAGGRLKTEKIVKEGPVCFIVTTTSLMIHVENETRNWSIYMDETDEQTRGVKDKIAERYLTVNNDFPVQKTTYRNAQALLKYYPVRIPYARFLSERTPNKPLRMRRDFERLLTGIEIITLLHQFQREIKGDNGIRYLEATLEDYFMAMTIFEPVFEQALSGTTEKTKRIVASVFSLYEKNHRNPITIKDLMRELNISRDTVLRWVKPAVENGEVEVEESKGKNPKTFIPGVRQNHTGLPTLRELGEAFPDLAQNFSAVDPLTGRTVTKEEFITPPLLREKESREEENSQKAENIERPKQRKMPPPGLGRWLAETDAKRFSLERCEKDRGDRSMDEM